MSSRITLHLSDGECAAIDSARGELTRYAFVKGCLDFGSDESLRAQVRRLRESEATACARADIADRVNRACWEAGVPARVFALPVPPHPGAGRYRYAVRVGDPREASFVPLAEWFVEVELEPFPGEGVLRGVWPGLEALLPEVVAWFRDFARDRPAWEVMSG